MWYNLQHICDVCGKCLISFGCCIYGDEQFLKGYDLCKACDKACKDAKEQEKYLKSLMNGT